jgi:hypothetical protein
MLYLERRKMLKKPSNLLTTSWDKILETDAGKSFLLAQLDPKSGALPAFAAISTDNVSFRIFQDDSVLASSDRYQDVVTVQELASQINLGSDFDDLSVEDQEILIWVRDGRRLVESIRNKSFGL